MIAIIAAYAKNKIIGKNGHIPWKLAHEQERFRDLTTGNVVIMGRRTYESIGKRLPNRMTIVLSHTMEFSDYCNLHTAHSLTEALKYAASHADLSDIFIAGGGKVYEEAVPLCSTMYITEIDACIDGDVRFPDFNPADFKKTVEKKIVTDVLPYEYVTFTRTDDRR
ncbi:MAG: dihydrofolate reductase [Treponema sp.]